MNRNNTSAPVNYADPPVVPNPPKPKLDKVDTAVVNKQDDNSYEESLPAENMQPESTIKQDTTNKHFEYSDNGEFDSGENLEDPNPKDDYL